MADEINGNTISGKVERVEHYRTRDLSLAAYFYYRKTKMNEPIELVGLEDAGGGLVFFIFKDKELCEEISVNYFNKAAKVEPGDFMECVRKIKDMMYGKLKQRGTEERV